MSTTNFVTREELAAVVETLRDEMGQMRRDLHEEITQLRRDLNSAVELLDARMDRLEHAINRVTFVLGTAIFLVVLVEIAVSVQIAMLTAKIGA